MMFSMSSERPEPKSEQIAENCHGSRARSFTGGETDTQKAAGIETMSLERPDGMKTKQPMDETVYDPISNLIGNVLKNKQGVGSSGYDYSDWNKATKDS